MKWTLLQAWVLRLVGAVEVLAFAAVFLPHAWMEAVHRAMGLGEMPGGPVFDSVMRQVSFTYGVHGVALWLIAADVRRYRTLVILTAVGYLVAGPVLVVIDLGNHMPWYWVAGSGSCSLIGGLLLALLWAEQAAMRPRSTASDVSTAAEQRVILWTGGQPGATEECRRRAKALPVLPAPAPLRQAAHISFRWGDTPIEIWASACSVRIAPWGDAPVTCLHCQGMTVGDIKPDEPTGQIMVLIPAHYVTGLRPGPTFRFQRRKWSRDLGVFPPTWPAPPGTLPLAEIERALVELLTPQRN